MGEALILRKGGVYRDRRGNVVGPLDQTDHGDYPFRFGNRNWTIEGHFVFGGEEVMSDLIEEVIDPASGSGEPRTLRVSVWFGFAPVVADVTVAPDNGHVDIKFASLEPKSFPGRINLASEELDKLAIIRAGSPVTLREAIEARAREEAFA